MADINIYDGIFVPTTDVWDVSEINDIEITSPEFKELLVRMYQNLNRMSLALNLKVSGYYSTTQSVNSKTFFPNPVTSSANSTNPDRQVMFVTLYFGPLPDTATLSIPHGITCTGITTFVDYYGAANDVTGKNYISLPYPSPTAANNIEVSVDATNVNITTGRNRTAFTICYLTLEFLQQ